MATLLQLVLDGPDGRAALDLARRLADLIDALELGPRLLRAEGPAVVREARDAMPDRPVACWAETEAESRALLEVGVEGLTVPGFLPDEVLTSITTLVQTSGRRILLDLVDVREPAEQGGRLKRLKPDLVKVPVGINFRDVVGRLRSLDIPLAFSGDWSVAQVPWLLLYRPVALMAGTVVTDAPEPKRIVEAIRARMAITPTMSRFY